MDNLSIVFEPFLKDLKPSASEDYIYTIKDDYFGSIVFSVGTSAINMISCPDLNDRYFNKMICINCIKQKTIGIETQFGILDNNSFINQYNCSNQFRRVMSILHGIKTDMMSSDQVRQLHGLNQEDSEFYNNILLKKADEGAGKFIFDDKIIYVAPCMLPGSKSNNLDAIGYHKTGNDYYIVSFITHKKTNDIMTLMRFLYL